MQKGIFSSIVTGFMAITLPTHAAMLLHLDAASPGSSPTDSWMDLSGNGNHFTNHDSILDHDKLAFTFGGPDPGPGGYPAAYQVGDADGPRRAYFERADDGVFDFDTDVTGTGTPFSIVAWSEIGVDDGDDFVSILLAKGATRDNEWKVRPRKAGSNTELIFNEVPQPSRMYTRADATPVGFHLTMITHDGSGTVGGTKFYYNGVETAATYNEDNLAGPILNDAPVRIGGGYDVGAASGRFFEGSIGFIEIWDEVKDASYALDRYNGGTPLRADGPPPAEPELVLHLDACSPGDDPASLWEDLTTNANHFANYGSTLDTVEHAFNFGGPDADRTASLGGVNAGRVDGPFDAYFELAASDEDFDFDTSAAGGDGSTPFTFLGWIRAGSDPGDNFSSVLVQKGASGNNEWKVRSQGVGDATEFLLNGDDSGNQLHMQASSIPRHFHMVMITHSGSGKASGTRFFFDGVEATKETVADALSMTISNDAPVRIGAGFDTTTGSQFFEGQIGIIEIWRGVKNSQYASDRYNHGAPARVGGCVQPPPPPETGSFEFVQASRGTVNYLTFSSELGAAYSLDFAIPPDTNFTATGWNATGNGDVMYSFDPTEPAGSSAEKTYRIRKLY